MARKNKEIREERMRQARLLGTHTDEDWRAMLFFFDRTCVRCLREGVSMTKDHVIPICNGGSDAIRNIQPLCFKCNASKGTRTADYRGHGIPDEYKLSLNESEGKS